VRDVALVDTSDTRKAPVFQHGAIEHRIDFAPPARANKMLYHEELTRPTEKCEFLLRESL